MRKGFAVFLCVCITTVMFAERMTLSEAESFAVKFFGSGNLVTGKLSNDYCVVQRSDTTGFLVISLSDACKNRIVSYSTESRWDEKNMPPAVTRWIEQLKNTTTPTSSGHPAAARVSENGSERKSITPLLTCHWHQNSPYNDMAPVIVDGGVKTVAGCVAIAAAQIVYYWRKDNLPATLKDTPTYIYGGAPITEVVPKGSPNCWELIRDVYSSFDTPASRAAVAQLCYVIGTTSYLNYASSTGGQINDAANAIYSQYLILSDYTRKSKYSEIEWEELLYSEVAKGYPVMCSGGEHAYVLDGYDKETNLFHFNFGWGGAGDGYYPVDNSPGAMGGYSSSVTIVYDIHPQMRNIDADILCALNYDDLSKVNISLSVVNNSTLPIENLCVYMSDDGGSLDDESTLVWSGGQVGNDGEAYKKAITVDRNTSYEYITYFLTDEQKNILAEHSVDFTAIDILSESEKTDTYKVYNLQGQEVKQIQSPGIYILNQGTISKKFFFRQ